MYFWKKAPFCKLLPGLITGIILQWQWQRSVTIWLMAAAAAILLIAIFSGLSFFGRFRLYVLPGIAFNVLVIAFGALLIWKQDIRNDKEWVGHLYQPGDQLIVTVNEPLIEKPRSYKANAGVKYLLRDSMKIPVTGTIILYFKKDSAVSEIGYGTQLLITSPLQEISSAGNPGGFDYKRYCLFQGITHQTFIKPSAYAVMFGTEKNIFRSFIYSSREKIVWALRENIKNEKELGLAEALLIGYKNDLEPSLVQSYTNTGVVHIIAISGLHLGLIYGLLSLLCTPIRKNKKLRWLRPVIILSGLWIFTCLAGAQASVLRSAVMFTCIVMAESLSRRTSIFNTLALSAFILLLINPFWLWDIGFQLSYAAVISIVIFQKPVYNWFYFKNKILDFIWKLNAITIAAQLLTLPLSIYHFHQLPLYFLLTNVIAVPLSSVILLAEILICALAFIPAVAGLVGQITGWMIGLMNKWIETVASFPMSVWDGLQISVWQTLLLYLFIAAIGFWLLEKIKRAVWLGSTTLFLFAILRSISFIESAGQKKIIVYNIPGKTAVGVVNGRQAFLMGDRSLLADEFIYNFNLKPAQTLFRTNWRDSLPDFFRDRNLIDYFGKKILLFDSTASYKISQHKIPIDLLLVSGRPRMSMMALMDEFLINKVILDPSVPGWLAARMKKELDSLGISFHDVSREGAFVMKVY